MSVVSASHPFQELSADFKTRHLGDAVVGAIVETSRLGDWKTGEQSLGLRARVLADFGLLDQSIFDAGPRRREALQPTPRLSRYMDLIEGQDIGIQLRQLPTE